MNYEINNIYNEDCMPAIATMENDCVDFTITDVPFNAVNRKSNGLRNLDKEAADIETFNLPLFVMELVRITKNSLCIFCGKEQFSIVYQMLASYPGTVRPIIWEKTNPSPMNGQYVYLSGIEMAVWLKKKGATTFHPHCKNTVFKYPNGKRRIHPTQKNIDLIRELILDNTNIEDLVFDPCMGSGTTARACVQTNRKYLGFEINKTYYDLSMEALKEEIICKLQGTTIRKKKKKPSSENGSNSVAIDLFAMD